MKNYFLLFPISLFLFGFSHCSIKKPNGGGSYGGGMPTYNELNDDLNDILRGPVKDAKCLDINKDLNAPSDNSIYPHGNPLNGALAIHASKYQSCRILDNINGSVSHLGLQPEVVDQWRRMTPSLYPEKSAQCKDIKDFKVIRAERVDGNPFSITDCSVVVYCQDRRHPPTKNNTINVLEASSDCSSFVSSSFRAVGLKMFPSYDDRQGHYSTTSQIKSNFQSKDTCFESPNATLRNLVNSGDIINSGNGHVVMIDKVGKDPFRIEEILDQVKSGELTTEEALKACSRLDMGRFDLSIIHSTSRRMSETGGDGILRETSKTISSGTAKNALRMYARTACKHFISQYPMSDNPFNVNSDLEFSEAFQGNSSYQRHKGIKDPRCVYPTKPKIQGEECVQDCLQAYIL